MASLKNIKLKIISVKKTSTVTRAMEAVSAVKMRKSQERALSGRAYAAAALSALERLSGSSEIKGHPLMQSGNGKTCVIIITSDKGLAGSLNSGVVRELERELEKRSLKAKDTVMLSIGRRGADYFASRGWDVRSKRENLSDGVGERDVLEITRQVLDLHTAGEISSCIIVYQNFLSTFEQKPSVRQIIPISPEVIHEMVRGIRPARGRYAGMGEDKIQSAPSYTIEPDPESVLIELLPRLLNIAVFHTLLEAKASEHSARMVAMKNATDKAKEMAGNLTRTFNKVRQAAITREVSEITSGIEAMR